MVSRYELIEMMPDAKLPTFHLRAAAEIADPCVTILACDLYADGSGLSVLMKHYGRRMACSLIGASVLRRCIPENDHRPGWQWHSTHKAAERVFAAMVDALTESERKAIADTYGTISGMQGDANNVDPSRRMGDVR